MTWVLYTPNPITFGNNLQINPNIGQYFYLTKTFGIYGAGLYTCINNDNVWQIINPGVSVGSSFTNSPAGGQLTYLTEISDLYGVGLYEYDIVNGWQILPNVYIDSNLPVNPVPGQYAYLTTAVGSNAIGLYVFAPTWQIVGTNISVGSSFPTPATDQQFYVSGPQGEIGRTGQQGLKGITGPSGPQGPQGEQGLSIIGINCCNYVFIRINVRWFRKNCSIASTISVSTAYGN